MPASEIFHKFKAGTLKSGSGQKVTDRKQAIAIAMKYKRRENAGLAAHAKGRSLGR